MPWTRSLGLSAVSLLPPEHQEEEYTPPTDCQEESNDGRGCCSQGEGTFVLQGHEKCPTVYQRISPEESNKAGSGQRQSELLETQGYHRIDARRTARRKVTGDESDKRQQKSHPAKREWVKWAHAEKQTAHQSSH